MAQKNKSPTIPRPKKSVDFEFFLCQFFLRRRKKKRIQRSYVAATSVVFTKMFKIFDRYFIDFNRNIQDITKILYTVIVMLNFFTELFNIFLQNFKKIINLAEIFSQIAHVLKNVYAFLYKCNHGTVQKRIWDKISKFKTHFLLRYKLNTNLIFR